MKPLDHLCLHLLLSCVLTVTSSSSILDVPQKPPVITPEAGRKQAVNVSKDSHGLQSDEPQGPSVELNYGISADRRGILSCEVGLDAEAQKRLRTASATADAVSSVYLMCPQVQTSICYFDCTPSCTFEGEGSATVCKVPQILGNVVKSCDYRILNSATILVKYTVNMEALDSTGIWSCEYQGVRSRPLLLQAAEQQSLKKLQPFPEAPPTQSITTESVTVESIAPDALRDTEVDAIAVSNGPMDRNRENGLYILNMLSHTQPEVILVLIIVVVLTMLVNSALILRCCLTSSYFKSLRRGKPDQRLGRLLCLGSRADKPCQKPEVTVHPLPVQAGHYYYQPQSSVTFLPHSDCSSNFAEPYARATPAYAHVRPFMGRGGSGSDVQSLAGSQSDQCLPVRLPPGGVGGSRLPAHTCIAATRSHETLSITSSARGSREYFLPSDPVTGHVLPSVYCLKTSEGSVAAGAAAAAAASAAAVAVAAATKDANQEAARRWSASHLGSSKDQLRGVSHSHHYPPSTVSTTIYDDLSASSYHAVTPMLVRLPAGETGIILCHRPDSLSAAGTSAMATHPIVVANDYTVTGCAATQVPPPQSPSIDENCTVSTQSTESGEYGNGKVLWAFPSRHGRQCLPSPPPPPPPPPREEDQFSARKKKEEEEEALVEKKRLLIYARPDTEMPVKKTKSSELPCTKEPYVLLSGTNP